MNRKLLFFDIDGTIMGTKRFIPESAKKAIQLAKKKGNLRFICTGRSYAMLPHEILALDFDGFICAGGTHVIIREKEIIDFRLSPEQIERIVHWFVNTNLGLFIEGKEYLYRLPYQYYSDEKATRVFLQELTSNQAELNLSDLSTVNASKFSGMVSPLQWEKSLEMADKLSDFMYLIIHRSPNLQEYEKALSEKNPHSDVQNTLNSSGYGFVEFLPNGYNKATGIEAVLKELGVSNEDAYGFGDSENDKEMLTYLQNSICMGNGSENMKKLASYVTAPLIEDGLYKAMEHFSLI